MSFIYIFYLEIIDFIRQWVYDYLIYVEGRVVFGEFDGY